MNTKHLVYFMEIARQKNMNKAAEALFVSQSSLSQYLSRLEEDMGTLLFYRKKGDMTLTPAGDIYMTFARHVLDLEDNLMHDIRALEIQKSIRVGINSIWGNFLMTAVTTQFRKKRPNITIDIFEENHHRLKKMIAAEELDLCIIATDTLEDIPTDYEILRHEELLFAISNEHDYLKSYSTLPKELTLQQLSKHFRNDSFILTKENSSCRPIVNQLLSSSGFVPDIICETSNMNTVRSMISQNIGVGFVPSSCADPRMGIAYFSLIPEMKRINAILHRKNLPFTDAETYFIDLVRSYPLFKSTTGYVQ